MNPPLVEMVYYETYYFANAIRNVLADRFAYLRNLHDFYGDGRHLGYIRPFPRYSAFHCFIHFVIDNILAEDLSKMRLDTRKEELRWFRGVRSALEPHPSKLPANLAMDRHRIQHESFEDWLRARDKTFLGCSDEDVEAYYDDLREDGTFDELLERMTNEVFFVLFQNRATLLLFNDVMAGAVRDTQEYDLRDLEIAARFARPGVLRRAAIPAWAQRAVYYRDRGRCVLCDCDLSGILRIWTEENFDHVVPLALGGLNDVTNLQLLCGACNAKKRDGEPVTSNRYEAWYDLGE